MNQIPFHITKPISYHTDSFAFQSLHSPSYHDLTICTQLTVERLPYLSKLAKQYNGPISVAMYMEKMEDYQQLVQFWGNNRMVRENTNIHLVFMNSFKKDKEIKDIEKRMEKYPVNFLRNTSRKFSLTKYIFLIDADFFVPKSLYQDVKDGKLGDLMNKLDRNDKAIIIVPAYWNKDMKLKYPNNKKELIETLHTNNQVTSCPFPSHRFTNFNRFESNSDELYFHAPEYNSKNDQEPYYISNNEVPYYNERLHGCGLDKIEQFQSTVQLQQYKVFISNQYFLMHQPHIKSSRQLCPKKQRFKHVHSARCHFFMTFNEYPNYNILNDKKQVVLKENKQYEWRNFYIMAYHDVFHFERYQVNIWDYPKPKEWKFERNQIYYFMILILFCMIFFVNFLKKDLNKEKNI